MLPVLGTLLARSDQARTLKRRTKANFFSLDTEPIPVADFVGEANPLRANGFATTNFSLLCEVSW